jgi:hypothetical protein
MRKTLNNGGLNVIPMGADNGSGGGYQQWQGSLLVRKIPTTARRVTPNNTSTT